MPDSPTRTTAFTFAIDRHDGIVHLTYHRQPDFHEWQAIMTKVLAHPQFRPGFSVLSDRRALTEPSAPTVVRQMARFTERHCRLFNGCLWAVVVAPAQLAEYGMARMGSVLFERAKIELQAFTDYERALAWLREARARRA